MAIVGIPDKCLSPELRNNGNNWSIALWNFTRVTAGPGREPARFLVSGLSALFV